MNSGLRSCSPFKANSRSYCGEKKMHSSWLNRSVECDSQQEISDKPQTRLHANPKATSECCNLEIPVTLVIDGRKTTKNQEAKKNQRGHAA
ncbi:hypothetical protein UY3_19263 [Chelonia mydas]|uniref:Uncharacterized protein n=1 Tax=Chelonia mydas TaxID=8469 RepID=M7AFP2_CHEMY|nr:hypothetical protein UY3_19263 [Chelonia mydas]